MNDVVVQHLYDVCGSATLFLLTFITILELVLRQPLDNDSWAMRVGYDEMRRFSS